MAVVGVFLAGIMFCVQGEEIKDFLPFLSQKTFRKEGISSYFLSFSQTERLLLFIWVDFSCHKHLHWVVISRSLVTVDHWSAFLLPTNNIKLFILPAPSELNEITAKAQRTSPFCVMVNILCNTETLILRIRNAKYVH